MHMSFQVESVVLLFNGFTIIKECAGKPKLPSYFFHCSSVAFDIIKFTGLPITFDADPIFALFI